MQVILQLFFEFLWERGWIGPISPIGPIGCDKRMAALLTQHWRRECPHPTIYFYIFCGYIFCNYIFCNYICRKFERYGNSLYLW